MAIKMKVNFANIGVVVEAALTKDGKQFCVLAGDNLQSGIAGFGDTANKATSDFRKNFRNETIANVL